ncbi:hypothetical protein [Bacillus bingmayongensis]|nr:hypothetical protein [Bacillus bingmayongensis]MBY0599554.1 hypothetical protein [Bacillus bingmayongensis]
MRNILSITSVSWKCEHVLPERISHVQPLFERIDVKQIEDEVGKLYVALK